MILPHISYCNIIWGNCPNIYINKILLLQKRALHAITNSHSRTPSKPLFEKLKILSIYDINKLQTALFMYNYFNGLLPPLFTNLFSKNMDYHQYNTRDSAKIRLPFLRYETSRRSLLYAGPKHWNSLNHELKICPSLANFKYKYKNQLLCNSSL